MYQIVKPFLSHLVEKNEQFVRQLTEERNN